MNKELAVLLSTMVACGNVLAATSFTKALTSGKTSVDMRLRYESVDQDNAAANADIA